MMMMMGGSEAAEMALSAPFPAPPASSSSSSSELPHSHSKTFGFIILIILGALALVAALLFYESRRRKKAKPTGSVKELPKVDQLDNNQAPSKMIKKPRALSLDIFFPSHVKESSQGSHQSESSGHMSPTKHSIKGNTLDSRKMITLKEGWPTFDMDQLLTAHAQLLYGISVFGAAYKVIQAGLPTIMIRHLRDVSMTFQEFKSRLGDLAKLNHVNVLPIVAYYFSENEKILLYEYLNAGNLSDHLHGKEKEGWSPLDWPKRAQIALDVARGISYIHSKGRNKGLIHGNIKPTNVLLRGIESTDKACLMDTGLCHLLRACPPNLNQGYRAPETANHMNRFFTHKADVYSFGVLLLELLTAKQPYSSSSNEVLDLPRFIQAAIQEEWTAEIFDINIPLRSRYEEEMVLMLKIAMECVRAAPRERPSMAKVVGMIKLMREFDDVGGSTYTDISTPRTEKIDQELV